MQNKTLMLNQEQNSEAMFFTGFTDRDGTMIYEHDIVCIGTELYEIQFELGAWMLVRMDRETNLYEQFKDCWNDDCYPLCQFAWNTDSLDHCLNFKIVTNIYQQKEERKSMFLIRNGLLGRCPSFNIKQQHCTCKNPDECREFQQMKILESLMKKGAIFVSDEEIEDAVLAAHQALLIDCPLYSRNQAVCDCKKKQKAKCLIHDTIERLEELKKERTRNNDQKL